MSIQSHCLHNLAAINFDSSTLSFRTLDGKIPVSFFGCDWLETVCFLTNHKLQTGASLKCDTKMLKVAQRVSKVKFYYPR